MARKSKWVDVESPDEPLADVARRALDDRLKLVWRYLQRSSNGSPSDLENVHQLRVSTRRAVAAMEIFEHLLPPRRARWMSKQLKRIRQAGGAARDLDVMLARFLPLAEREVDGPYGAVVHRLKVARHRAQDPLDETYEKFASKHFGRRVNNLVKRTRLRTKDDKFDEPNFAEAARTAMEPMVLEFFRAGDADFAEYAALHAFRIEGKHLRYAMEIFAGAYQPAFREEVYPLVADLQDRLGEVNDHASTHELFCTWLADDDLDRQLRVTISSLVNEEQRALEASRREFLDWWTVERRADWRQQFAVVLGLGEISAKLEAERRTEIVLRRAE